MRFPSRQTVSGKPKNNSHLVPKFSVVDALSFKHVSFESQLP